MTPTVREGYVPFEVTSISQTCQTWYKIIGDLKPGSRPLIALNGGPGVNSSYLEIISDVTNARPDGVFITYDQIGNGLSTHLPEKMGDTEFWTDGLFVDELENLFKALNIEEYDLLGHSWGGMFGSRYAVKHPAGLKHLTLMSVPSSIPGWVAAQRKLRAQLPEEIKAVLDKHELRKGRR